MSTVTAQALPVQDIPLETVSRTRALWATLRRKPLGLISAALLVILVLTAIFADVLAPFDPIETRPEIRLSPPSRARGSLIRATTRPTDSRRSRKSLPPTSRASK